MAIVKFYLEKRTQNLEKGKQPPGKLPILLIYSFNGKRLQYYTGLRIEEKYYIDKYWTKGKEPIKNTAAGAEVINRDLSTLKHHVERLHSNLKVLGTPPSISYFKEQLDAIYKGKTATDVCRTMSEAAQAYLEEVKREKAHNSYRNNRTPLNHFVAFFEKKHSKKVDIKSIEYDENFFVSLQSYIWREIELNNTAVKYLSVIRKFFTWLLRKKYINSYDFNLSLTENDIEVIFLNAVEVAHLKNLEIKQESWSRVRDVFVFGCYTGMRYSDIAKLKKGDIKSDQIQFYIQKGGQTTSQTVPLLPQTREILSKYQDLPNDKALPVISNQKMNEHLKDIMRLAGFNQKITIARKQSDGRIHEEVYEKCDLITCHTSRKSFITIALTNKMPEAVIKSITGHSKNSKSFSKYYKVVDDLKQSEMQRAFSNYA